MQINTVSPVEEAVDEIAADLDNGDREINPWQNPSASLAIESGQRALTTLREVMAAMADLEPGAALTVNDALRRGLRVTA